MRIWSMNMYTYITVYKLVNEKGDNHVQVFQEFL